jgi:HK97 family phage major capsid protein
MSIAEKIQAAEQALNASKDQLTEITKSLESSSDESLVAQIEELSGQVETQAKSLETLRKAEAALATKSVAAANIVTAKHLGAKADADLFFKSIAAVAEAHTKRTSVDQVLANRFSNDDHIVAVTKAISNPAMTNVSGWAQELVRDTYAAFMDTLKPESVIPRIGMNQYSFDGFQSIKIPMRAATPRLDGAFRAEGAPIPVKQMGFASKVLTPKSMGVISTFSNELFERSTPNILDVIRSAIITDTAEALDAKFLSADAAVAGISPEGSQNGILAADTAVSLGTDVASITADLRGRLQRMASLNLGKRPVWVMNPARAWGLQLATNAVGAVAYPEMANGTLIGAPVITSTTVPAGVVFLFDAAELYFAGGAPRFVGTDVATLHMEDTTPAAINGSVAASPVRSLYQTNTAAIRAMWELDWAFNRAGCTQTITGVEW